MLFAMVVLGSTAPSITTQPADRTVLVGQKATFSIIAKGTAPLHYQWVKNNITIAGATSASYTTPATTVLDDHSVFLCRFSNSLGKLASRSATLCVQSVKAVLDPNLVCLSIASNWRSLPPNAPLSMNDSITLNQISLLKYYKSLGYTHVYYNVFSGGSTIFSSGKWDCDSGNYTEGNCAVGFRRMKAAMEANGLIMIPMVPSSLTHLDGYIACDPSVSEFYDAENPTSTFASYCATEHNGQTVPNNSSANHVGFVGNYPKVKNTSVDQLVELALKIVNANWGNTALGGKYPKYVHIGHDENGYGTACFIAEGRAKRLLSPTVTKSDLVAREIAYRYKEVQDFLTIRGKNIVTVMLLSDSYEPADLGQYYGLCGDIQSGAGGVFYKIIHDDYIKSATPANQYPIAPNLIAQPWGYSLFDGCYRSTGSLRTANRFDCKFSKKIIANYFSNLGIRYIPLAGEVGSDSQNFLKDTAWVELVKKTTYEWVLASRQNSKFLAGYSLSTWISRYSSGVPIKPNPVYFADMHNPISLKSGFSACLLAFAGWTHPFADSNTGESYSPDFYNLCKYQQSRNNLSWEQDIDYKLSLEPVVK
jgi:hypothetical protein